MKIILFDDTCWYTLRPLTLVRPVAALRVGILTIREKWEKRMQAPATYYTQEYLRGKFPFEPGTDNWWINGSVCPDEALSAAVKSLLPGEVLRQGELLIAYRSGREVLVFPYGQEVAAYPAREYAGDVVRMVYPYHIFSHNAREIASDFGLLTRGRISEPLNDSVRIYGEHPCFVEPGARVNYAVINTQDGPVYIGAHAQVMEGVVLHGPFALCEHAVLKVGAKAYGGSTLGPHCKCGGETRNVVLQAYSNKAHDGYLGNAVLGEWCNIGAGTSASNLKNNYTEIKLWDYDTNRFRKTGLQFCGIIMGDHSKLGINMMINTGTVIGVGANLFGSDFPRNFIPSFTWGSSARYTEHKMPAFEETARLVMARRGLMYDETEHQLYQYLNEHPAGV